MGYQYRCERCKTTSPPVLTRAALGEERRKHRQLAHGGHIPDGERVIEPEPFHFSDVPPIQWLVGGAMILAMVIGTLVKLA